MLLRAGLGSGKTRTERNFLVHGVAESTDQHIFLVQEFDRNSALLWGSDQAAGLDGVIQNVSKDNTAVCHVDIHIFYHHDFCVRLNVCFRGLLQLGCEDGVQKRISCIYDAAAGRRCQLILNPGDIVQYLRRFSLRKQSLYHLPVMLHVMVQAAVLFVAAFYLFIVAHLFV